MEEKIKLLEEWKKRIRNAQKAHYKDAEKRKTKKTILGILTVVSTTLVGTSALSDLGNHVGFLKMTESHYSIFIGLLSILAAIFASLQTFLNYSEKSEKHLTAARKLSSLKKEIQQNLITLEQTDEAYNKFIFYVRETWDSIINEAPLITKKNFITFFEKKKKNKKQNI